MEVGERRGKAVVRLDKPRLVDEARLNPLQYKGV